MINLTAYTVNLEGNNYEVGYQAGKLWGRIPN